MSAIAPIWLINAVGVAAGVFSIMSFVPQIVKILRERAAENVSFWMFSVSATSFTLWTTFGVLQMSWPIAVSNAICLGLVLTIVALRLKFGDAPGSGPDRGDHGGA